ncbi:type II secretion system F family protein [Cohnella lubricantis]|uniref:Type II secretion system F family protein n=1 Tax=Cohnella lubricantis TaxID=2163172 RepID=A0A841TAK4_9BACL|nr:type II secretion system F family protein [Cohnella lubricantis]MBB6677106.1 type II secretion system F family protein [Cohnella lubricantis]MBP2118953.1 tight adherence protein C [Cohnella lubricantis]
MAGYVGLVLLAWKQALRKGGAVKGKFHVLREPVRYLIERPGVYRAALPWLEKPKAVLAALNGGICTKDMLLGWFSEALGLSAATWLAAGWLGIAANNGALALLGAFVAALLPLLRQKELRKRLELRRQTIVLELPELLNRLLLMVNAGENVLRALERCLQREQQAGKGHPLYAELGFALAAVKRGESFGAALEEFGRRCSVPEAKLFATTLLINSRRGGETFVSALRELSRTLWEQRKAAARTLGEQASSRMAFPLAVIFLIIMVLVGAPSMLMMSH